jgi:hypothetical protein
MIPVGVPAFCMLLVYVIEEVSSTGMMTSETDTRVIVAFFGAVLVVHPEKKQDIRRNDTHRTQKRPVRCVRICNVIFMGIPGTFSCFLKIL